MAKRRSVYLHYRSLRLNNVKSDINENKEENKDKKKDENENKDDKKIEKKETEYLKTEKNNNDININKEHGKEVNTRPKTKYRGGSRKFLFLGNFKTDNLSSENSSPKFPGRNNFRRSSLQNPNINAIIKERMSGKKNDSCSSSSSSSSQSFSDKMNNITEEISKNKNKNKTENSIKSTKVDSKEKEEDIKENKENIILYDLEDNTDEEEDEEIDETKGIEVENNMVNSNNELVNMSSPVIMQKVPGISDHLFNHISKRINHILESSKIKQFNLEEYKFYRRIGEGSYGVIHCLIHEKTKEKYALKKIIAYSLNKIQEFTKEFELVHLCQHPNILKIYGLNINMLDQTTYSLQVLMEKADRDWDKDIKRRLQERKYYTEEELIYIMEQLTSALLYMKEKLNITHRDIKPQNVLIFEGGIYKLADFGEAKEIKLKKNINTLRGTELYMSPALYNGLKVNKDDIEHDPFKSDLFSLGFCLVYAATMNFNLLYELRNIHDDEQIRNRIRGQLKDNYSPKFIEIINKMVELDEKNRIDFKELADEIKNKYGK